MEKYEQEIDLKKVKEFANLEFLAKQVVEGFITGLHKSPFHGFSVEFSEHRLYNNGESIKNIDWKLFARTERLYVKEFEEETNLRCHLVIDTSSSMYFPDILENKIHFSVYAAAAIMELCRRQRDAVSLALFDESLKLFLKAKSTSVHQKLILSNLEKALNEVPKNTKTSAIEALHEIAESANKRSLILLFSDMFDSNTDLEALFAAMQHLRYRKHEVILFHVMDKHHETNFEYSNRPHIFIDLETGDKVRLNPAQIKDKVRENAATFLRALKLKCAQYKIDYIEADIHAGFKPVLLPFLLKRTKMM